jgi:hypothetical protein
VKAKGKWQRVKVKSADALRAKDFAKFLPFAFCPLAFAFPLGASYHEINLLGA